MFLLEILKWSFRGAGWRPCYAATKTLTSRAPISPRQCIALQRTSSVNQYFSAASISQVNFGKSVFCGRKFRNFGTFPTYKLIFRNCLWQRSPGRRRSLGGTLWWRRTSTSSINSLPVCSKRPPRRSCALCKSR